MMFQLPGFRTKPKILTSKKNEDYNLNDLLKKITNGKNGIEIGGKSPRTGKVIYENTSNLDNIVFSKDTVWAKYTNEYEYYPNKKGNIIINDAVNITNVQSETYDYLFASHSLEHIANPMKAIDEWLRIVKKGAYLILILPEKTKCFDHNRNISDFNTLLNQYQKNVGEDDLSTLKEILGAHDLAMDIPAGDFVYFTKRSLDNFNNRCLHHYVYSPDLLKKICNYFRCEFIYTITNGLDIWFIMKKPE